MSYVFNDTTGAQDGLIQECEDICTLGAGGISGNTALMKTFTRRLNQAKDRFYTIAFRFDKLWNWDDRRYADGDVNLPIATTNLTSGMMDYLFSSELLMLTQVFAKDTSGVFHEIVPQDDRTTPNAYLVSDGSGVPTTYELVGNSILLSPVPNYNSTAGLKVVFKRKAVNFSYTDGAVAISVPEIFFKYLANAASYPFLLENNLKHAGAIKQEIIEGELAAANFIANRALPKRNRLTVRQESNK